MVDNYSQKQMLGFVAPWVQKIDLNDSSIIVIKFLIFAANPLQVRENLENLVLLTYKYADEHPHVLQHIWTTVADKVYFSIRSNL